MSAVSTPEMDAGQAHRLAPVAKLRLQLAMTAQVHSLVQQPG